MAKKLELDREKFAFETINGWLLALLGLLITSSIGYYAIPETKTTFRNTLAILIAVTSIASLVMIYLQLRQQRLVFRIYDILLKKQALPIKTFQVSKNNFVILATTLIAIATLLHFVANYYDDIATEALIARGYVTEATNAWISNSDTSLLLYYINNKQNTSELIDATKSLIKAKEVSSPKEELTKKMIYFNNKFKLYRRWEFAFIVLGIIFNFIALRKKDEI